MVSLTGTFWSRNDSWTIKPSLRTLKGKQTYTVEFCTDLTIYVHTFINGKEKYYVHELEIPVPCKIIYNPDKPLACGARVWIEILDFDLDLITS